MNPSLAAQLLNPKAVAKEKSKKRAPNYGTSLSLHIFCEQVHL